MLVSSDSSTIGVSGGNFDGEGSLEPMDGMSTNSASESEAESDSLTDFDSKSEDSEGEVKCSKGTEWAAYC